MPDPEWITQLAAHFADPLVGAVAPRVRPATGANAAGRYLEARAPVDMGGGEALVAPLTRLAYVPAAALLVRRAAVGSGFDPELRYGEDVDLVWRMVAAGWRVRYDPAAEVRHVEPGRWRPVLARRFRYGRSAAPLARRHPGLVPPLVLQAWPAAVVAALLARRPVIALAAYGAGIGQLARLLRGWGIPARDVPGPMAASVLQTWLGAGRWAAQYALPAAAAGLAWPGGRSGRHPGRTRAGRRLALAASLAGPPAAAWLRGRPRLDPVRFTLAYLADEAAYGAGVYRGAAAERLAGPLLPRLAWRPRPAHPGYREPP
jgi:mycofactocin system glycosyltransferase